jgi:Na+-transporting methylmalonyl-CoA/oxaloacetate decarboxylase gamma subunit
LSNNCTFGDYIKTIWNTGNLHGSQWQEEKRPDPKSGKQMMKRSGSTDLLLIAASVHEERQMS